MARVVVPHVPHHVTQRGNRRQPTFFRLEDYQTYLRILSEECPISGVNIWAYCLMPNHVHLIAIPDSEDGLRRALGETHRQYTLRINQREGWQGHLWQGRFASFPMDEKHLLAAARYIELNPVKAGIVNHAEEYPWSSARAHLAGRDDFLVRTGPLLDRVANWTEFLAGPASLEEDVRKFMSHERSGRPLGDEDFIINIEHMAGRSLRKEKPGPKRKNGVIPR